MRESLAQEEGKLKIVDALPVVAERIGPVSPETTGWRILRLATHPRERFGVWLMSDIEKSEFVEVPGFEEEQLIDMLLPFVRKLALPKRIIKLPMELRMTNWVANGYMYGLIASIFILSVSIYVLIDSANRVGDLSCRGKGGKILHGNSCSYHFYLFSIFSGFMGLGSYIGDRKAADVYQRAARITGPHLRLTRDSFWCHELIEPSKTSLSHKYLIAVRTVEFECSMSISY